MIICLGPPMKGDVMRWGLAQMLIMSIVERLRLHLYIQHV